MTDEIDVAAVLADGSPVAATKALDGLIAKFRGPPPSATPTDAAGARARLAALASDPEWYRRWSTGSISERNEFAKLTAQVAAGNPTDDAIAGAKPPDVFTLETTTSGELNSRNRAAAVAGLREIALPDDVIKKAIDGHAVSGQEIAMAKQVKAMRLSDESFVARYMKGDLAARREMSLLATILSGEVA